MSAVVSQIQGEPALVEVRRQGGVATLVMNRGAQFNALSSAMIAALQTQLDALAADQDIRVVVLAGAGRAFCAGHDLREMRASPSEAFYQRLFAQCTKMMRTLQAMPQPVIARVHGLATAAGCQLVATCDLAVAAESAGFAIPGGKGALFCHTPLVAVARNLSRKRALEMAMTGDTIDARTAADWGLVNRVVPDEQLVEATLDLITRATRGTESSKAAGKQAYYRQIEMPQQAAYAYASDVMAERAMDDSAQDSFRAFLNRRHR